jgi:hypothetical protein
VVSSQNSLLKYDALCLELNGLEEVSELKLDARQLRDARSHFLVHWTCDLEQGVYALAVEFKGSLKLSILVGLLG